MTRAATATADGPTVPSRPRVLSVGPDHRGRGGMATVERQILEHSGPVAEVRAVSTHVEGSVPRRLGAWLRGTAQVLDQLARHRVDILHLHVAKRGSIGRKALLTYAAGLYGVPVVLHCHGGVFAEDYEKMPAFARGLVTHVFRRAQRVVVLGNRWRGVYVDMVGVDPEKVVVALNAVEIPATVPYRSAGTVRIVFLGRFGPGKGSSDLIRAMATLPADVRGRTRLVMAGHGEVDAARALVAELAVGDVVEVRSWIDPPERDVLLAESSVFVLPSPNEGLPMSMLEAMAWGVVPVVTAVGGIPEVIVDGENGLFVTPGDVDGIAAALVRLVREPELADRLAVAARTTAERHGLDNYVHELGEVWRAALASEKR